MNYQQIIEAIKNGKKVCWNNASYKVIIDSLDQVMISYLDQNHVKLDEQIFDQFYWEKDFYIYPF